MLVKLLLICLGGFAQGNRKDDVGDVPYENQGNAVNQVPPKVRVSTGSDYGNVPYEKGKEDEYGDIPYDKVSVATKPHFEDYGNILYEKDIVLTPKPPGLDIKGKLLEILGGREVPGLGKTTGTVQLSPKQTLALVSKLLVNMTTPTVASEIATTLNSSDTVLMRADSDLIDYAPPVYIDESNCGNTCSTCTDKSGYRVYCLNGTTTQAPSDLNRLIDMLVALTKDYEDYNNPKLLTWDAFNKSIFIHNPSGWADCPTTTTTTDTPIPTDAPHNLTGRLISKCFVCGLFETGIPHENSLCSDSFLSHVYKKHCTFLNREGWYVNGTNGFYMWGRWTGGCSMRFVDITGVYTQRTCRNNVVPAMGSHYISRRMAKLEYSLRREKDACVSTPQASLVPLSRGISLYTRFTVCVCSQNYCNRSERVKALSTWITVVFAIGLKELFEVS